MKRVLAFLAVMLLPLSVMAMTPVSDSTLSDVTGQAGVDITNNLTMDVSLGTVAWGDSDGIGGATTAGWVGISPLNLTNLSIDGTQTIDVYTAGGTTYVRMGMVNLAIGMDALSFDVALGGTTELGQVLGKVTTGNIAMTINGYADISAKADCGVVQTMDIAITGMTIGFLSWGDTNGAGTADDGYVGISGLSFGDINIGGTVSIDVVTVGTVTSVVQAFSNNFTLGVVGPITGKVMLSNAADLSTGGELGDIYISNCNVAIDNGSTMKISAH